MELHCTMCKYYGRCRYQQVGAKECGMFALTPKAEVEVVSALTSEACIGTGWGVQSVIRAGEGIGVRLLAQTKEAKNTSRETLVKIGEHFEGNALSISTRIIILFVVAEQEPLEPPRPPTPLKVPEDW